jgi:hypothetical protein
VAQVKKCFHLRLAALHPGKMARMEMIFGRGFSVRSFKGKQAVTKALPSYSFAVGLIFLGSDRSPSMGIRV